MGLQLIRQNFGKRWMVEPIGGGAFSHAPGKGLAEGGLVGSAIAVNAVPGGQSLLPRLIQPAAGSNQDATAAKVGSICASISAAQTLGLAGYWLPRVGVGIRINRLSPELAGLRGSVTSVLGVMTSSYSFKSVACEPHLHEGWKHSWMVCVREEVGIGPANHVYAWVARTKERCTAMVFGYPGLC
jgi:hypothetical protein